MFTFAFSIFHLQEIDLEKDTISELINFNLIPPVHYYLHNATGSHSLCALNGKSTFKFCTEYKFSPLLYNKRQSFHLFSPHNSFWIIVMRGWGAVDGERSDQVICFSQSLLCLFVMNNRLQMSARDCLVRRWDIKLLEVSTEEARSVFYQVYLKYLRKYP